MDAGAGTSGGHEDQGQRMWGQALQVAMMTRASGCGADNIGGHAVLSSYERDVMARLDRCHATVYEI